MAALTSDRNTPRREGLLLELPIEANVKIFAGAIVARNGDGRAVPAADTAGLVVIGRAESLVDNTGGAAEALPVPVSRGLFAYGHAGLTRADLGKPVFVADDQTVALTSANSVAAGILLDVDEQGAWVALGLYDRAAAAQDSTAAADAAVAAGATPTKAEFDAVVALANELKADLNGLLAKLRAAHLIAT
jgi:hypothetical protein